MKSKHKAVAIAILDPIFTLLIGGLSIYHFYQNNFFQAVILLFLPMTRLFYYLQKDILEAAEKNSQIPLKFRILINIEAILGLQSISLLFDTYKKEDKNFSAKFKNKSDWIEALIENYKKIYNNLDDSRMYGKDKESAVMWLAEEVTFNILNKNLWKNNVIDFSNNIDHRIVIPSFYKGESSHDKDFPPFFRLEIRIRLIVVNGLMKLQLNVSGLKDYPGNESEVFGRYATWETITTFPFMYVWLVVPSEYLNSSFYLTESYRRFDSLSTEAALTDAQKKWKEIKSDISDHKHLNTALDDLRDFSPKKYKILDIFEKRAKKRESILEENNFFLKEDDCFINNFLSIEFYDYSDFKDHYLSKVLPDYGKHGP